MQLDPGLQVSVVVPVKDGATTIGRCLDALLEQDLRPPPQLLVVDNGSTDGTPELVVRQFGGRVTLLREKAPGSYAARNRAIAHAWGEVIAFTDADCVPRKDWLSRAVASLPPNGFVVGGIEVHATGGPLTVWEAWEIVHAFPQEQYWRDHQFGVTANLVATAGALQSAGPFNATLLSGGDREWCQRAVRLGVVGDYVADAVVEHPPRTRWSEMYSKSRRVNRGTVGVRRARGERVLTGKDLLPPGRSVLRGLSDQRLPTLSARMKYLAAVAALYATDVSCLTLAALEGVCARQSKNAAS